MGSIKVLICFVLCAFSFLPVKAQTFAEWFEQKKTQLKYLTQQITALEQYEADVKKGYQVLYGGWRGIGGYVKGEFDLHSTYYSSLRTVNPVIWDNPKADSIVSYAQLIPLVFNRLRRLADLDADTWNYIRQVKGSVLSETNKDLAELQLVLADGKIQMTDDERMSRVNAIYGRVLDKLVFSRSFCSSVDLLILQRNNSINDVNILKGIYGLN